MSKARDAEYWQEQMVKEEALLSRTAIEIRKLRARQERERKRLKEVRCRLYSLTVNPTKNFKECPIG